MSEMTTYVIWAKAVGVEHKTERRHIEGFGPDAVFKDIALGWFLLLERSHEALHLGLDNPAINPGDWIKITLEKAKP